MNDNTEVRPTRLDLMIARHAGMPAGRSKAALGREIEIEMGVWDAWQEARNKAVLHQIPEVRASVLRQRVLTGASGVPESHPVSRPLPTLREGVINPSYTDGLYYADPQAVRDLNARINVQENAVTRMGALCFVKPGSSKDNPLRSDRRYQHHERTAERFKSDYEGLFGAGVPALDNSRPVVDRSPVAHDSGMAAKIDRHASMRAALDFLGPDDANTLIDFIVLCTACEVYADTMPSGQKNQRQVTQIVEKRLGLLDSLSRHWGYQSRAA